MKQTFTRFFQTLMVGVLGLGLSQSAFAQYCIPTQLGGALITNVTFNTLNNTTPNTAATPYYSAFPASGSTFTGVTEGLSYPLSVTTGGNAIVSVWIDLDHSNTFDAAEWMQVMTTGTNATITYAIPAGTIPGFTGMRVRSRLNGNINGAINACTGFGSGECEDYTIEILSSGPCVNPVLAGTATASLPAVCPSFSSFLSSPGVSFGTGIAYQWYSSPTPAGPWTAIAGATNAAYSAFPTALTYYHLEVSCSGGAVAVTNDVSVDLNSFVNCYCTAAATSTAGTA